MAKGGSSGENFQRQGIWLERKSRVRKGAGVAPTMMWRRRTPRHTPRKKILNPICSDNVESSPCEAMISKIDNPLMCMASSTGYSTDTFEHDEEQFIKGLEQQKTPQKSLNNKTVALENSLQVKTKVASFVFQKRLARIDWRAVHAIDIDCVIREVDINTLETVLDTIAFGDIQGEDTRNFTEANFVKLFRLAQLMVEYLLHGQELLADHKAKLLQAGTTIEKKSEKIRSQFLWQRNTLLQTRHELKQAKKTLKTYEVMFKIQGKTQASQINQLQVRHCPFCEKVFESSYYLDMHVGRRHQKTQEVTEDKILAMVSKAEESTSARMKAETSITVQTEIQQLRERYQADLQRAETASNAQVRSLQEDLKQSNNQLHEVQTQLEILQIQILSSTPNSTRFKSLYDVEKIKEKDNDPNQERLYYLESKFTALEHQVKTLGQENCRLLKELNVAYAEVSDLQLSKRKSVFALKTQVEDLRKENQHFKRTMSKVEEEPTALSLLKEMQGPFSKERLTRKLDKDQGLHALVQPTSQTQRIETISTHYNEEPSEYDSSPKYEHYKQSISPTKTTPCLAYKETKYESSLEKMKTSMQRQKSSTIKKIYSRRDESPAVIEEMRAKLEREMIAAHTEKKRCQKVVHLAEELEKDKLEEKKKVTDIRSCKQGTLHSHNNKLEIPSENESYSEDEVEKHTTPHDNEKAHRIQEIAEVAAMDVGEEAPIIPIPEKQKWLTEHPFMPIPTLPYVVAKYPHPKTDFEKAHKKIENEFNGQLQEELKKFGIASSTNGISDNTYNSISSALEKQRSVLLSQVHSSDRKLMEYERGAIVWHTQRAIYDRDIEIIESQFDITSDLGSDHEASASNDSGDESGKSNYNSSRSHQSHKSDDSDSESEEEEEDLKPAGSASASAIPIPVPIPVKSSKQSCSPGSSEMDAGSKDDLQETSEEVVVHKNEGVLNRAMHINSSSSKADTKAEYPGPRSPPDGRLHTRAFSWKQKQESTTRLHVQEFSSRERGRTNAHARQSDQGEEVEEELGLGDWDSNEETVPSRGKQRRVQIDDHVSVSQDSPIRDLSPPKELLDLQQVKSSMASTSYKPIPPPPSSPKSSTATTSAENTCRANFQKTIHDKPALLLEKDETKLENEASKYSHVVLDGLSSSSRGCKATDEGTVVENNETDATDASDESNGSSGSDGEENKIFKELTSEIDEIISL